jgi:hypothetical protein|tara:strand:- start:937 stop:1191 length:255 start_codon:yes stop_codon:yes gene_type:complete
MNPDKDLLDSIQKFMVGDLVKVKGDISNHLGIVISTLLVEQETFYPRTGTSLMPAAKIAWLNTKDNYRGFYFSKILELVQRCEN